MKLKEILILAALFSASSLVCKADSFGIASGYNLVALGVTASKTHVAVAGDVKDGSEVTGRVAAAGNISELGTIGANLGSNDPFKADATFNGTTYDLVAGGTFTANTSINSHGSAFEGTAGGHINFNGGGKLVTAPTADPIDFDALRTSLENESASIAELAGSTAFTAGTNNKIILTATDPNSDVFNITAQEFASGAIDVVTGSWSPTIIINVTGSLNGSYTTGGIFLYNGQQDFSSQLTDKVLFNFPDATTLNTSSGEFAASILAPYATLTAGTLDGTIIVANATGLNGEVHNIEFDGTLPTLPPPTGQNTPPVPEPGTLALVGTGILSVAGRLRRRK